MTDQDFNGEEMKNVVKVARVHCPGFTEDMFESLMVLEKRFAESGYLEVVEGILRLEEEKGITVTDALKVSRVLIEQKQKLDAQVPDLENKREKIKEQIKQASDEYKELIKALETARLQLVAVKDEYEKTKKEANEEKRRMEVELECCHREHEVTREEVIAAGRLKKKAVKGGFSMELLLELAKEFTGYENAAKELSEGLQKHASLTKYLGELDDHARNEKSRIDGEIKNLESRKKALETERVQLTNKVSQLQEDIRGEEELRRFYNRYVWASPLIEHLATWNQVFFARCLNPFFMMTGAFHTNAGNARFWTDKPPLLCPQCGLRNLAYDERVYQSMGWPVGQPVVIKLGDNHG